MVIANSESYLVLLARTGKFGSIRSYSYVLGSSFEVQIDYVLMRRKEERGRLFLFLLNFHLKAYSSLRFNLYIFSAFFRR